MSVIFPNTFRKPAEAHIDHSLFWSNFWIFWTYTIVDFWIVAAIGAVIFGITAIFVPLSVLVGGWFLGVSLTIYGAVHVINGFVFRKAQKAFIGQNEQDVSDIPFASGAVLVLISILHLGFLLPNLILAGLV